MVDRDGGPAFPVLEKVQEYREDRYWDVYMPMGGMTLRDYFAGQALAGGLASFFESGEAWSDYDEFARSIWAVADAMLEARKK